MNVGECPCSAEKGSERGREWKKRKHLGKNYQENKKIQEKCNFFKNYTKWLSESDFKQKYKTVHLGEKGKPLGKINRRRRD